MLTQEHKDKFITLLALVYQSVNWKKVAGSKFCWDVWNHRIRAAATRGTIGEFISRLCNYFGLQSLPAEAVELIDSLQPVECELLDLAHREHIPFAMSAVVQVQQKRKAKSNQKSEPQDQVEAKGESDGPQQLQLEM